jgi:hypothetical protein
MKLKTVVVLLALSMAAPHLLFAQRFHPFVMAGSHTDDGRHYAGITVGGVYDLIPAWVSAGVEGDIFFSGGYAAGRAGPVGQVSFLRDRRLKPFAIGGYKWGEGDGAMIGGGVEFRPAARLGFRGSVEDILTRRGRLLCGGPYPPCSALPNGGNSYFTHGVSLQFGIVFR